jgi:phage gp37-like protein
MHAYRDAIRDLSGNHVVRHAATLYPGKSVSYGNDVSAIHSYPGEESDLRGHVRELVKDLVASG